MVALSVGLALVGQLSFADAGGLHGLAGQGSIVQASSDRGLVPAVSRSSVTKADSNAEDRAGLGLVAVLFSAVAAFTFPARRGRFRLWHTVAQTRPGRLSQARAPPVAPVV
jgi:hypothetical protein